jgi:Protein of unknown function (DUF1189)
LPAELSLKKLLKRFPEQLLSSIQDFGFYRRIFRQPLKDSLVFLVLFSILVSLLSTIITFIYLSPDIRHFLSWAKTNAPAISVSEGVLSVSAGQPLVLKYRSDETWILVFDTTGVYKNTSDFNEPVILLGREELVLRIKGQVQTYSWKDFGTFEVNADNIGFLSLALQGIIFPLGFIIHLFIALISKSLQAVLVSPLAYSIANSYGVRLPFRSSFAIALYSLVPATALDLLVKASGMNISFFMFIYITAAIIYTYLATKKCVVIEE